MVIILAIPEIFSCSATGFALITGTKSRFLPNSQNIVSRYFAAARSYNRRMFQTFLAADISHVIQISVAPVFLLAGIGSILGVMTNRLARVIDSRDVPTLLERAARVLEAKGVIIWMADKDQGTLQPTLTHGYSDKVLTRLGVLDIDADNVTSLSYRSMRPQTMAAMSIGSAGAIAVPLITAAGCTGVLAVETRDSKPANEMVAVARIIAAQFATLIAPGELAGAAAPAAAQG